MADAAPAQACGVSASDYLAYTRVLAEYCDTEEQQQLLQQHKAVAEAAAAWSAIKEEANACELSDTMLAALRVAQAMPTVCMLTAMLCAQHRLATALTHPYMSSAG